MSGLSASQDSAEARDGAAGRRRPIPEGPTPGSSGSPGAPRPPAAMPGGPLRPHVPTDLQASLLGSSFYAGSFAFRTWMRESPQSLVSQRRLSERPDLGLRPLREWSAPGDLRVSAPTRQADLAVKEPGVAEAAPSALSELTPSRGDLPTLRPEEPLRSLRFAALETSRRSRPSQTDPSTS